MTVDKIQKAVAEHYGLKQADLISERRARAVARPRQVAMWLAKQITTRSLPDIGRRFGGRDHTTVLHAVRRIEALKAEDPRSPATSRCCCASCAAKAENAIGWLRRANPRRATRKAVHVRKRPQRAPA